MAGDNLFRLETDGELVVEQARSAPEDDIGPEEGDGSRAEGIPGEDPDKGPFEGSAYSREEMTRVVVPSVLSLAMVLMVVTVWYLLMDQGPEEHLLPEVEEEGSFNLVGHWAEGVTAYGPHARSINLTLEEGDVLSLIYTVSGPPGGIHVRLQHPLHPSDGINGTGGTAVHASSVGGNGSIHFLVEQGGAYQVYFWHPGSAQEPGEGDAPDDHVTAAVSYRLTVNRAHRP